MFANIRSQDLFTALESLKRLADNMLYVATVMSECGFPKYLLWSMSPSTCYGENQSLVFKDISTKLA